MKINKKEDNTNKWVTLMCGQSWIFIHTLKVSYKDKRQVMPVVVPSYTIT